MKALSFLFSLNELLQIILKALKNLRLKKEIKNIDKEITAKSDRKTKQILKDIL